MSFPARRFSGATRRSAACSGRFASRTRTSALYSAAIELRLGLPWHVRLESLDPEPVDDETEYDEL
jgi:hypothetical protein